MLFRSTLVFLPLVNPLLTRNAVRERRILHVPVAVTALADLPLGGHTNVNLVAIRVPEGQHRRRVGLGHSGIIYQTRPSGKGYFHE